MIAARIGEVEMF